MQNHILQNTNKNTFDSSLKPLLDNAIGMTSPFASRIKSPASNYNLEISQKQIEILEDAIRRYEKLEDIKKFSHLALEDIENVTEEDIQRALEIENMVSIEDEKAVLNLIQNEGFLKDLESSDFSKLLSKTPLTEDDTTFIDDDFSDFDF